MRVHQLLLYFAFLRLALLSLRPVVVDEDADNRPLSFHENHYILVDCQLYQLPLVLLELVV